MGNYLIIVNAVHYTSTDCIISAAFIIIKEVKWEVNFVVFGDVFSLQSHIPNIKVLGQNIILKNGVYFLLL